MSSWRVHELVHDLFDGLPARHLGHLDALAQRCVRVEYPRLLVGVGVSGRGVGAPRNAHPASTCGVEDACALPGSYVEQRGEEAVVDATVPLGEPGGLEPDFVERSVRGRQATEGSFPENAVDPLAQLLGAEQLCEERCQDIAWLRHR
ncbi:hypothetical protein [Haliangium sp.]|uniref:hypothetical protein n=1 Tax=Haliangium sp. TaxID=2663208 RepID=UPI003D09EFF2